jgi:hypothetical protein
MLNRILQWERLTIDREISAIAILSTLLLLLNAHHSITPVQAINEVGSYLIVPLFVILLAFRKSPKEFGFCLGDWKTGFVITVLAVVVITPILYFLVRSDTNMRLYYAGQAGFAMPIFTFLSLIGWEFFSRMDALWICPQIRGECYLASSGALRLDAHLQT